MSKLKTFFYSTTCTVILVAIFVATLSFQFVLHQKHHVVDEHAQHGALYHEQGDVTEGFAMDLSAPQASVMVGKPTTLSFFAHTEPGDEPVTDLVLEHEKYVHVIGMRDDLTEFFHIHPTSVGNGVWNAEYVFKKPGAYKIWTDVDKDGQHTFGHPKVVVVPNPAAFAPTDTTSANKPIEFLKNIIVGKYRLSVDYPETVTAGQNTPLDLIVHTVSGEGVKLEPYLGADVHLIVVKNDLSQYVHAHPEMHEMNTHSLLAPTVAYAHNGVVHDEFTSEHTSLNVTFPEAGIYKLFAQFRPQGALLPPDTAMLAEFYVNVVK